MLTEYIRVAMSRASYEQLEDGTFYGSIPPLKGVWADADTQARCQAELEEVLEEWISLRLSMNLPIPSIEGVSIEAPSKA